MPPNFVCSGDGTRQIVNLKTKIRPVSINAAANCNEYILWSDNAMPALFAQCSWVVTELHYQFVGRLLAAKRFHIVLVITIRIYFSVNAMNKKYSMELVWKYGRYSSIPFLKSSNPFHFGILPCSIPVPKFPFHSFFHTMSCYKPDAIKHETVKYISS